MRLHLPAITLALIVSVGCDSIPDVTFADDTAEGGPNGTDGGPNGTDGGPNGTDGGPNGTDAGPCTASGSEICDDGIDNDCNGKADCADPACTATGFTCVEAAPSGWSLVAFAASATPPSCPPTYGAAADVPSIVGTGVPTCSCGCGIAAGTACAAGMFTVSASAAADCTGGTPATENVPSNTAACTALGAAISVPQNSNGKVVPPTGPTSCDSTVTKTIPPVVNARTCAAPPKLGAGCTAGRVCAPAAAGFGICAQKSGVNACPAALPTLHRTGTTDTDTRDCGVCSCALTPCSGSVSLFQTANCNGGKSDLIVANNTCSLLATDNFPGQGAQSYKSTVTGGCAVAAGGAPQPTGALAFANESTICCK